MKFNCDRYRDYRRAKEKARIQRLINWHPWFAWYPKKLEHGDCRWLETIERRCEWFEGYHTGFWLTRYRAKGR
jgi:hypothetical protein